jgi:hypothetical protein
MSCCRALHLLIAAPLLAAPGAKPVDFNRDIRPILSDNCFTCHGPDEKPRMANLRLDTREGLLGERPGGAIVAAGDSASSKLYQRLAAGKPALRMPPAHTGKSVSAAQVALIRKWIDEGAKWETHWAYLSPRPVAAPQIRSNWPRNPIDSFVLERLHQEKLRPSPEANRETLLRRVTLDLTGLPPTTAELEAFLKDRTPGAYERVVDRLLASPRYGEKMALHWLDIARYADTHGYHIDSHRTMWPWRDWVIRSFNNNLPYDRFVIDQLAGDLLDSPTQDQRIATGFNRNHMINFEGGAIDEEYRTEYVVDRIEATSTAFLGMTMGCARCHDHKYDPISQRDFYRFFAFFNTVVEKGLDGRVGNAAPNMRVASIGQEVELDRLICDLNEKQAAFPTAAARKLQTAWEKERARELTAEVKDGIQAHFRFDDNLEDSSGSYLRARVTSGEVSFGPGMTGRSAAFEPEDRIEIHAARGFTGGRPLALSVWIRPGGEKDAHILRSLDSAGHGWELYTEDSYHIPDLKRGARLFLRLTSGKGELRVRSRQPVLFGQWTHIAVNYNGSVPALFFDGAPAEIDTLQASLDAGFANLNPLEITGYRGSLDDLRIFQRQLAPEEIERLAIHMPADTLLAIEASKRSRDEQSRLREYFLTHAAPDDIRAMHAGIKALTKRKENFERLIPTTMVMQEMDKPRDTAILARGQYDAPGEKVTAGVPSVLPPLPEGVPPNRLALARWFTDPSHPLTARVAVNRFWQTYFGTGLVKTAEDFGSQGEAPSHPQLLDWLALEFQRTGWDVKAMQRLIVTSATYRQVSKVTPELAERDPENRLLARMSRRRLPGELVRDNALAVSGLLNPDIGGPSVFPYQPAGLWDELAYGGVYSAQAYTPSTGRDLYRRSMYTFWKRTVPPAELSVFDAPDREKCVARRPVTNTPLQALVLMNDPTYVEAARALAGRVLKEAKPGISSRIALAFELTLQRKPSAKEAAVLRTLITRQTAHFAAHPDAALQLLDVGESKPGAPLAPAELAAWTGAASVLLSLDEAITKE